MSGRPFQYTIGNLLILTCVLAAVLGASRMLGMETLLVVFPICVGLAVMRCTDARHPILLGAIGGGAAGIIGLGIPTVVWASIPLDSGMVNQYKTPIAVMFATSTVFGAVAGVIMGTLCGLHQ